METQRIIIIGTGGMGREALWIVRDCNRVAPAYHVEGFVTNDKADHGRIVDGASVLGPEEALLSYPGARAVCAIGDPRARLRLVRRLADLGVFFQTIVHPSAVAGPDVAIGEGSIVSAHATLTTAVRLGSHCIVNVNASVSHDCVVGDFATLSPGVNLAGGVHVEEAVEIGVNACVLPRIRVGRGAIVGAGAVVTRDVAPGTVVVGAPARAVRRVEDRPAGDAEGPGGPKPEETSLG